MVCIDIHSKKNRFSKEIKNYYATAKKETVIIKLVYKNAKYNLAAIFITEDASEFKFNRNNFTKHNVHWYISLALRLCEQSMSAPASVLRNIYTNSCKLSPV